MFQRYYDQQKESKQVRWVFAQTTVKRDGNKNKKQRSTYNQL